MNAERQMKNIPSEKHLSKNENAICMNDHRNLFIQQKSLKQIIQMSTMNNSFNNTNATPLYVIQRVPFSKFLENMRDDANREKPLIIYTHVLKDGWGDIGMINNLASIISNYKDILGIEKIEKIATLESDTPQMELRNKEQAMADFAKVDTARSRSQGTPADSTRAKISNFDNLWEIQSPVPDKVSIRERNDEPNFTVIAEMGISALNVNQTLLKNPNKPLPSIPLEDQPHVPAAKTKVPFASIPMGTETVIPSAKPKVSFASISPEDQPHATVAVPAKVQEQEREETGLILPRNASHNEYRGAIPAIILTFVRMYEEVFRNETTKLPPITIINVRRSGLNGKFRPSIKTVQTWMKIQNINKAILLGEGEDDHYINKLVDNSLLVLHRLEPELLKHMIQKLPSEGFVIAGGESLFSEALGLGESQVTFAARYSYQKNALKYYAERSRIIDMAKLEVEFDSLNDLVTGSSSPKDAEGFLEFKKLSTLLKEKDLHSFIRKTLEMQSPA